MNKVLWLEGHFSFHSNMAEAAAWFMRREGSYLCERPQRKLNGGKGFRRSSTVRQWTEQRWWGTEGGCGVASIFCRIGERPENLGNCTVFPHFGDPFKLMRAEFTENVGIVCPRCIYYSVPCLGYFLLGNCFSFRNEWAWVGSHLIA